MPFVLLSACWDQSALMKSTSLYLLKLLNPSLLVKLIRGHADADLQDSSEKALPQPQAPAVWHSPAHPHQATVIVLLLLLDRLPSIPLVRVRHNLLLE